MWENIKITSHAGKAYALRKYGDVRYFSSNPAQCYKEIRKRLEKTVKSEFKPEEIFNGRGRKRGRKGIKAKNAKLFQDDEFIYSFRDNVIFTIIKIPGKDIISDFLYNSKK